MHLTFVAFPAGRKVTAMRIQENVLKKLSLVGASSRPKIQLTEILKSKLNFGFGQEVKMFSFPCADDN